MKIGKPQSEGSLMILSSRQRDVLTLIAQGLTDKEIATRLKISIKTVEVHVSKVLFKLSARNRANAVFIYLQNKKQKNKKGLICDEENYFTLDGREILPN